MNSPADLTQLKERMRTMWAAGDFGEIARYATAGAEDFVDRLNLSPGAKVLDVACGKGNLAIPAARKGARITGVDIAANLLEQARQRAADERLIAAFDEGDAENLPYPDAHFAVVMSMFGAMFAPRPEKVATELLRVCRPGGTIAMANWTPQGFAGRMFALSARYVPPPPGILPSALWGEEPVVRQRLASGTSKITTTLRIIKMEFPFPPRQTIDFFRRYFGPIKLSFAQLDSAKQTAYAAELEALWNEGNEADGQTTRISNEYLEVIAERT